MFKLLLVVILLTATFASCKKKEDKKLKMTLLTQKEWVFAKAELKQGNGSWQDDSQNVDACDKDDKVNFKTNNTFDLNQGTLKCNPNGPQIETGTWAFLENETKLNFDGDVNTIDQLDENNFALTTTVSFNGITITYKITFKH